jgi:YD repeat-containing protein
MFSRIIFSNSNIFKLAVFAFALVSVNLGQAQDLNDRLKPRLTPPSPNVAEMEKFGTYSVNMATGLPNISIPLYEVKSGSISVPITLNYNAGGFRMFEKASWVGLGWSLEAGGALSRSVQDKPDDLDGYLTKTVEPIRDNCTDAGYDYFQFGSMNFDNEPDVYSYHTPTVSGKFILQQNQGQGKIYMPLAPVKVNHYPLDPNGTPFQYFDLLTDNGTKYVFGKDKNNSFADDRFQTTSGTLLFYRSAWHLTRILAPNNDDEVNLFYQDGGYTQYSDYSYSLSIVDQVINNGGGSIVATAYNAYGSASLQSSTTIQSVIQRIEFENGQVEFIASDPHQGSEIRQDERTSKYLKQIIVKRLINGSLQPIIEVNFGYSYFEYNFVTPPSYAALKLDQITITDKLTNLTKKYKFSYWTDSFTWNHDTARDYWGFYNGHDENMDMIPRQKIWYAPSNNGSEVDIGFANREADSTYMKEGVLKVIQYPTGGTTTFDYQIHKYRDFNTQEIKLAGGLRIKSILSDPAGGNATLKEYKYGPNNDGTGLINRDPTQATYMTTLSLIESNFQGVIGTGLQRTFYSSPTLNLDAFDNSVVYYTRVEEYNKNLAAPSQNHRTVHTFSFAGDNVVREDQNGIMHKRSLFWKRGKPLTETGYNSNNQEVYIKTTHYDIYNSQLIYPVGAYAYKSTRFLDKVTDPCFNKPSASEGQYVYGTYEAYTDAEMVGSVKMETLPGPLAKTTTTTYNSNYQPMTSAETSSNGKTRTTSYKYADDFPNTGVNAQLLSRNMISTPLEKEMKLNSGSTIYKEKTYFKVVAGSNAQSNVNNVVVDSIAVAPNGQNLEGRISFPNYDEVGNILGYNIIDGSVRGVPTTMLWGYAKSLPIAELQNVNKTEFDAVLPQITIDGQPATMAAVNALTDKAKIELFINDLRTKLASAKALVTGYVYEPNLGVVSMIDPNGRKRTYAYNGLSSLIEIRDHDNNIVKSFKYHYVEY